MNKEFPPGFEEDVKNISIDFDGVIHDWNKGWHDGTCYGEPIEGALEAVKLLSEKSLPYNNLASVVFPLDVGPINQKICFFSLS